MGWGAMMGLGQALQQVGQIGVDNHKAKMKEQLEIEKENRAAAREEAKEKAAEAKKLITPETWQVNRLEDGSLVKQGLNYRGEPIKDALQPMSNVEIEEFNRKQELDDLNTKHKSLEVTLSGKKVEHYDEDRARDIEYDNARTEAQRAQAAAARARAANPGGSRGSDDDSSDLPAESDIVTTLMKDLGSYGEKVDRFAVEEAATQALAHARKIARQSGEMIDPLSYARTILRNRYGTTRKVSAPPNGLNWR